ncbi:MAG TPA: alpha/beta fold hydrolase [Pyrinomonadaceae bacterium]|jgi:alpha/beta superfamily hydrolase|nr:alpha/beta fold hydrolase [Pyrinomonadaceae bacterium]
MYPAGNLFIPASHGKLEAILKEPSGERKGVALVCHPHPLGAGTMHNKVVFRAAAGLLDAGLAALRFNFRGVGASTGTHDEGRGEQDDVRTALDFLAEKYPQEPITLAGFSFGSRFGTEVGVTDKRVVRLISIGSPVDKYNYSYLNTLDKPILFVHCAQDEYGNVGKLRTLVEGLPVTAQAKLVVFENCGHFFDSKLDDLKKTITAWVTEQIDKQ